MPVGILFIFHLHQLLSMPIKNPSTHQLMPLLATIEQVFEYPSQGTHMLALSVPFFLTSTTTSTIQLSTASSTLLSGVLWDVVDTTPREVPSTLLIPCLDVSHL